MPDFRFALDEDVAHPTARLLRLRGLNADSAKEFARLGLTDAQVLLRAAEQNQTLVTHNRKHFEALHEAWVLWRWRWSVEVENITGTAVSLSQNAGIVIVPQIPIRDLAPIIEEFNVSVATVEDRLYSWNRTTGWSEPEFSSLASMMDR